MNSMYNDDEMKYFHDNEEKYFFPENEEIYLGYECEVFQLRGRDEDGEYRNKWYPHVVELESNDYSDLYSMIILSSEYWPLRTPYLTKEQLEAEGWKHDDRYDNNVKHFYKNEMYLRLYIGYCQEKVISYNISIFNEFGTMFKGKCKDINTFRKICKLLEIQ